MLWMVKLAALDTKKVAKCEERLRQQALKTTGALQQKQTKSMTAQAHKGKAPACSPLYVAHSRHSFLSHPATLRKQC
jgi:hypothetical protein